MISQETLIRNMELANKMKEGVITYTDEEFATNVLGRKNVINGGMVLGSPEWPMDPVKRIRGMFLRIWPF